MAYNIYDQLPFGRNIESGVNYLQNIPWGNAMNYMPEMTGDNAMLGLGALGTAGAGISDIVNMSRQSRAQDQMNKMQRQRAAEYQDLSRQPINWQAAYQPITDLQSQAMTRGLKADMATRGVPMDSAWASNMVAQNLGEQANQRQMQAFNQASGQRQQQLQELGSRPMPQMPYNAPRMGDYGAFAQAYQGNRMNQLVNQQNQQRQQFHGDYMKLMQGLNNPGQAQMQNLQGMPQQSPYNQWGGSPQLGATNMFGNPGGGGNYAGPYRPPAPTGGGGSSSEESY